MSTFAFVSLGCPKNLVDSERMLGKLAQEGFTLIPDASQADVVVVNTCGFIEPARQESLGVLREMVELKTGGKVKAVIAAAERVTGATPKVVGRRIVGDANLYVHGTGIPTFYYGASNHTAHADVEWVSVERIRRSAQVYLAAAAAYCGVSE